MAARKIKYQSAFDIIGPIMVGPSSSHTAGAVRIGNMARAIFGELPDKIAVTFYGSFAETYKGHGTSVAVVAGILGFETNDERIPEALKIAEEVGVKIEFLVSNRKAPHPNTIHLALSGSRYSVQLTATSIGGGSIQLFSVENQQIASFAETGDVYLVRTRGTFMAEHDKRFDEILFYKVKQLAENGFYIVTITANLLQNLVKMKQCPDIVSLIAVNE